MNLAVDSARLLIWLHIPSLHPFPSQDARRSLHVHVRGTQCFTLYSLLLETKSL